MKLYIPKDIFDNRVPPRLFLCTTGKKIMYQLPSYEVSLNGKWNAYAELSFSIDRQYTDVLTGETKIHPAFDKAEGLRMVLVENIGYFTIQDPDSEFGDKDTKRISCFSSEYASFGSKYLENFRINTGDVDSKEVIYESSKYGDGATKDQMYKPARSDGWDSSETYYHRVYVDADSYDYEQIQIVDEVAYSSHFGENMHPEDVLYIHGYANVQFYDPHTPELSLLHLIFAKVPEWKIGHVDYSLRHKERKFDESRIATYDFLTNNIHDTFKAVAEFDTLKNEVNFYEEAEDGINEDNTVQTRWDTDIYISRQNLANQIQVKYSTDDIKTKLKVSGADDMDIREVNLGKNYIMNLDFYHGKNNDGTPNYDWMEQDLYEAYDDYLDAVELYSPQYTEEMQKWVAAYNKWNDLMNAVPTDGNVVLVGDPFEKLYCIYTPINTAYSNINIDDTILTIDVLYTKYDKSKGEYSEEINKSTLSDGTQFVVQGYAFEYDSTNNNFKYVRNVTVDNLNGKDGLIDKLTLYHINEDINLVAKDNILLRLKNKNSDIATIRIYNANEEGTDNDRKAHPDYKIHVVITYAQNGITGAAKTYTMSEWINGLLTAEYMKLDDFTVQYIGTMGAYLVLAKDEKQDVVLEEYGVNMLKEKHDTYTTIFQAQTEAMFSQEKYQCIAQKEEPEGYYDIGTRWLDTDSNPIVLKVYTENGWEPAKATISEVDQINYENYQRYIDNYEKLAAVQSVLLKKEREAEYCLSGYAISDISINTDLYERGEDGLLRYNGELLEEDLKVVAQHHFGKEYTVSYKDMDDVLYIYTFTTSFDPNNTFAVYLNGTTPYVSYADSQAVHKTKMNWISDQTELSTFFDVDQWMRLSPFIREDEYSDQNFLLTSYESEEERLKIYQDLIKEASKELKTLSQPSLEFSMEMANILALPEFESLFDQFQLGNFVRVGIRDGYVKRARLLDVTLNFDDFSDFSCSFGNLITTKDEIDKHAELLSQAVTAGKQVAQSAGTWQRAVDKSNRLEEEISDGLQNTALQVGRASGQAISWDEHGFRCRKLVDGTTDQYLDEQIAIINNKIVFTNDGWKTSKSALGEFEVDINGDGVDEKMYGLLADAVVSGFIKGSVIEGGSLKIGGTGGTFIVNEDGSVQILASDAKTPVYATKDSVDFVSQARQYHIELSYDNSTIFGKPNQTCTISCKVYQWDEDITSKLPSGTTFVWLRNGIEYKRTLEPKFTVKNSDIDMNAQFACQVTFDEELIK